MRSLFPAASDELIAKHHLRATQSKRQPRAFPNANVAAAGCWDYILWRPRWFHLIWNHRSEAGAYIPCSTCRCWPVLFFLPPPTVLSSWLEPQMRKNTLSCTELCFQALVFTVLFFLRKINIQCFFYRDICSKKATIRPFMYIFSSEYMQHITTLTTAKYSWRSKLALYGTNFTRRTYPCKSVHHGKFSISQTLSSPENHRCNKNISSSSTVPEGHLYWGKPRCKNDFLIRKHRRITQD